MQESVKETGNKKVIIIGGGPAGLTASYQLSKADVESVVLEKDWILGGISRTVNYKDYYFDIGGHRFFTKNKDVEDIWNEILKDQFLHCKRISRIHYNDKFFNYPLRPVNALLGLGIWNSFLIIGSYLHAKMFPSRKEETFDQWISNRFGKRLYTIFFKTYTEKVWGVPCNEIRAEWAAQRIKGLSLVTALKNALVASRNNNGNKKDVIKTLIDEFSYPKYGPGMMWQSAAEIIQQNGSQIHLGTEVVGIKWSNNSIEALEVKRNGKNEVIYGTDFISSMPIREAVRKFQPAVPEAVLNAANELKYRDFLTIALIINKRDLFPDNWIYIHDPNVKVGRIQNFKNWSPFMVPQQDKTCLGLEYFCFEGDSLWTTPDDQLIDLGKYELEQLGFITAEDVEDGTVVRMQKAYPVYDSNYQKSLKTVREFLDGIDNFHLVGRNGQHKYNNQDHSMLTAMMAAENVLGAKHDLWLVNEEQEYHEEIMMKAIMNAFGRVDKLAFATALGTVAGLFLFFATIFLVIKGGDVVGANLQLLNQYFIGYSVTVKGSFIGMAYSFAWVFLFGWLAAYIRNFIVASYIFRLKKKTELLSFKDLMDHF